MCSLLIACATCSQSASVEFAEDAPVAEVTGLVINISCRY